MSDQRYSGLDFLDNPWVSGVLTLVIILYASLAAPKLPAGIAKLFGYNLFRLVLLFLIAYFATKKNAAVAIVLSVALIVSLQTLNRVSFEEQIRQWLLLSSETPDRMKYYTASAPPADGGQVGPNEPMDNSHPMPANQAEQSQYASQMGMDSGFETGSQSAGCYGSMAGVQGYDYSDKISEY
jgi:hypothetical protein